MKWLRPNISIWKWLRSHSPTWEWLHLNYVNGMASFIHINMGLYFVHNHLENVKQMQEKQKLDLIEHDPFHLEMFARRPDSF
jgi:hypothetical protein